MTAFKKFSDLKFKPSIFGNGIQALCFFKNGYGVSVIRVKMDPANNRISEYTSYTRNETEWELAIIKGTCREDFKIICDSGIASDVIGYLKGAGVSRIMKKVQMLKKKRKVSVK